MFRNGCTSLIKLKQLNENYHILNKYLNKNVLYFMYCIHTIISHTVIK